MCEDNIVEITNVAAALTEHADSLNQIHVEFLNLLETEEERTEYQDVIDKTNNDVFSFLKCYQRIKRELVAKSVNVPSTPSIRPRLSISQLSNTSSRLCEEKARLASIQEETKHLEEKLEAEGKRRRRQDVHTWSYVKALEERLQVSYSSSNPELPSALENFSCTFKKFTAMRKYRANESRVEDSSPPKMRTQV